MHQLSADAEAVLTTLQTLAHGSHIGGCGYPVYRCILVHSVRECYEDLHVALRELSRSGFVALAGYDTAKLTPCGLQWCKASVLADITFVSAVAEKYEN